jgi:regulatory protein
LHVPAKTSQNKLSENQSIDAAEAYARITRYCAYQERSHDEVREKLFAFGLRSDTAEEIISRLIVDGFVNEERFAKAFAGGKFRIKHWGRLKIEQALKAHDISTKCIAIGLREIDDDDYRATIRKLILKKSESATEGNLYKRRDIISKYVIAKGFEPELVWEMLKEEIRG